ncbi:MAG: tetratricopeptide repeat protein [Anaerolineales bacterium]
MPPVITKAINALETAHAAVSANPKSADAHAGLGWAYYGKGQFAEALKSLQEALALDSEHLEAHYGLGLVHKGMGSKMEAVAEFQRAAALAEKIEDNNRNLMLARIIRGHINQINLGDWSLGKHEKHV